MAERRAAIADMRKHELALRKAAGAGGCASEKPESVTLPGFPWRSEIGHAEISHVKETIIGYRRRVNDRPAREDRAGDLGMRS